jgi:HEAT repeat protein
LGTGCQTIDPSRVLHGRIGYTFAELPVRLSNIITNFSSAALLITAASSPVLAQDLATRVGRAPDGVVRVQFASRPGTCGDGRDAIGYRKAFFAESFQSIGNWNAPTCVPGPVRVALTVANGQVTRLKTYVAGSWARTSERVTDLGTVSPVEASTYFFALVPRVERAGDKSRVLLPAVLADAGDVIPQLTSLARDDARIQETRRQALQWLGLLGDARVVPTLVAFARGGGAGPVSDDVDEDDTKPGKKGLATAAMAALSFLNDGAGVPALIDITRSGSASSRQSAVFWLGQTGDPRALATLHSVIENTREDERVRAHAVFALSHGDDIPASEYAYLRALFPRITSEKVKEQILMGMGEDKSNGSAWLVAKARDTGESMSTRKTALFWAGQRELTPTKDLVAVYRSANEESLKEHAIFVLSQRQDDAALTELMRIAQEDSDKHMRARAMFWLGQKDDPRVTKMIGDRIAR